MRFGAWWAGHFRPRDVFALLCLVVISGLCALVWTLGSGEASARKDVIVDALGIVAGLAGFYSGARTADRAREEAREARDALEDRGRDLDEATALVAALQRHLGVDRGHSDEDDEERV